MKRVLLFLSMLLCLTAVMATGGGDDDCDKGNNNKNPDPEHPQDPLDGTSTSGGISADVNEIIRPTGYDSIHWVREKTC